MTSPIDRERTTFRLERVRALAGGILETAQVTFLLLIAERWFRADPLEKGILTGAGSAGLLLTPVLVSWAAGRGWNAGQRKVWAFVMWAFVM